MVLPFQLVTEVNDIPFSHESILTEFVTTKMNLLTKNGGLSSKNFFNPFSVLKIVHNPTVISTDNFHLEFVSSDT